MIFTISSGYIRVNRLFIVAAFLTFALTATPHAGSALAQSKSAGSHVRNAAPHTRAAASKKTKSGVNPAHSAASIDRDLLLRLETTEKALERQLQIQTETTQRWKVGERRSYSWWHSRASPRTTRRSDPAMAAFLGSPLRSSSRG